MFSRTKRTMSWVDVPGVKISFTPIAFSVPMSSGGIIPPDDIAGLKAIGVKELFTPGTSTQDIVRFVREHIRAAV